MHRRVRRCAAVALVAVSVAASNIVTSSVVDVSAARTPAVTVDPCGTSIAKPGGGYWRCTFADEFNNTSSLDLTKWSPITTAATGFTTGVECFIDNTNNVSVSGGYLKLTVRKEAAPFTCATNKGSFTSQYTAGEISTFGKWSQAYGRFEIRAKFPAVNIGGLHAALWMTPQVNKYGVWPWSGEIDIAEAYSSAYGRPMPTVHYMPVGGKDANAWSGSCVIKKPADFHKYLLTWTPTTITIAFDGKVCINDSWTPAAPLVKPQPFDQPFVLTLTQGLGVGTNAFKPGTTPLPASTQIDYVHVWS